MMLGIDKNHSFLLLFRQLSKVLEPDYLKFVAKFILGNSTRVLSIFSVVANYLQTLTVGS